MSVNAPSLFEALRPVLHPLDPAELHGLLCGLLCLDAHLEGERWLACARAAFAEGDGWPESVNNVAAKLLEFGAAQINAPDGSITPLLPDDDAPLQQRVEALGRWCHGWLYGLGLSEIDLRGVLSEESWEFLDDVTDIAQIGCDTDQAGEADETAYMELVEYLRVGVLTIRQDIPQAAAPPLPLH